MMSSGMFLVAAIALAGPRADSLVIQVDSGRHEITITAGPYSLPALATTDHHAMMTAGGAAHDTPLEHFSWPIDGWFRGFRLHVTDARGRPVPRRVVHHLIMVNFNRRQLVYAAPERLFGAGAETDDATVPKTIGVPMARGMRLGMYVGWHNDTGRDLPDVYLKLTLLWTPKNQVPRPVSALPIYMDANLTVGGSNTFDIPPGRSSKAHEFTLPVGGRLLGVGGHLHNFGVGVRLEDAATDKILTRVAAKHGRGGAVTGVERRLFGVTGDGLKLKEGHRYRVVGAYHNPTDQTLSRGAMAHMVGLFAPDDMAKWPAIDLTDPEYQRDLASLQVRAHPDGRVELIKQGAPVSR